MGDQAHFWSAAAERYEDDFIDPYRPDASNPLPGALQALAGKKTVADLGCGTGALLPLLSRLFKRVFAVDFAEGMLARARQRCREQGLANVDLFHLDLVDLAPLAGQVDVAVAVNSLVMPSLVDREHALSSVRRALRQGGHFLGIVPAMDGVHYQTMLLVDRARERGLPEEMARLNAAHHGEHPLYDFAFGTFTFKGIEQHFWHPFEIPYRLERAGFQGVSLEKVLLSWEQQACGQDLRRHAPPWDWFFHATVE
jgi:SAM-dependent methyltransferase